MCRGVHHISVSKRIIVFLRSQDARQAARAAGGRIRISKHAGQLLTAQVKCVHARMQGSCCQHKAYEAAAGTAPAAPLRRPAAASPPARAPQRAAATSLRSRCALGVRVGCRARARSRQRLATFDGRAGAQLRHGASSVLRNCWGPTHSCSWCCRRVRPAAVWRRHVCSALTCQQLRAALCVEGLFLHDHLLF